MADDENHTNSSDAPPSAPNPNGIAGMEKVSMIYTNAFAVSFTPTEFVIDCAVTMPGQPPHPQVRVILAPVAMKQFLRVAGEILGRYEERMGEIPLASPDGSSVQ